MLRRFPYDSGRDEQHHIILRRQRRAASSSFVAMWCTLQFGWDWREWQSFGSALFDALKNNSDNKQRAPPIPPMAGPQATATASAPPSLPLHIGCYCCNCYCYWSISEIIKGWHKRQKRVKKMNVWGLEIGKNARTPQRNKRTGCFFGMTHYENAATKRVNQRLDYAH